MYGAVTLEERSGLEAATPNETAEQILKRTLSPCPVAPISSKFATRPQNTSVRPLITGDQYRIIGLGSCGTVFEIPGTEYAYKKGSDALAISTDFNLTNQAYNAVMDCRDLLQREFPDLVIPMIPACWEYFTEESDIFWPANLVRFPISHRSKGAVFRVDRIRPVPEITRNALIETFFEDDQNVQRTAKSDEANKDCLIRIYLGEREPSAQQGLCYTELRNFPLRLNMMEELGLDISQLAREMALGLAILHWKAQVDAMDTEFVLGSATNRDHERPRARAGFPIPIAHDITFVDYRRRDIHFWMLDFDKAHQIKLNLHSVETLLVPAFRGNDPYFPQPQMDKDLWRVFSGAYLKASRAILQSMVLPKDQVERILSLPQRFLDGVEASAKRTADWDEERDIVFG